MKKVVTKVSDTLFYQKNAFFHQFWLIMQPTGQGLTNYELQQVFSENLKNFQQKMYLQFFMKMPSRARKKLNKIFFEVMFIHISFFESAMAVRQQAKLITS